MDKGGLPGTIEAGNGERKNNAEKCEGRDSCNGKNLAPRSFGECTELAVIISGGTVDDYFVRDWILTHEPKMLIAADAGMGFFFRNDILPQVVIGDFDSAAGEALQYFRSRPEVEVRELNPVKDDTDTEAAVRLAIERGVDYVTIFGATGSRIDHVIGNIAMLGIGMEAEVGMELLDATNRIRMTDGVMAIRRDGQFGKYVSLIPYAGGARHVTLTGFKYPLADAEIPQFGSLGVSNEIVGDEGVIEVGDGILLVIESRD